VQVESCGVIFIVELTLWSTPLVVVDVIVVVAVDDVVLSLLVGEELMAVVVVESGIVVTVLGDVGAAGVSDDAVTDVDSDDLVANVLFLLTGDDDAEVLDPSGTSDVDASWKLTELNNVVSGELVPLLVELGLEELDVKSQRIVDGPASTWLVRHPTFAPG